MRQIMLAVIQAACLLFLLPSISMRANPAEVVPTEYQLESTLEVLQRAKLRPTGTMLCGPVCLYIGCRYFGLQRYSLGEIAHMAHWSHSNGASLLGLQYVCHEMDLHAEALELGTSQLKKLMADSGALAIIENKKHFFLLKERDGKFCVVSTPLLQPRWINDKELARFWNGRALLFSKRPLEFSCAPRKMGLLAGFAIASGLLVAGVWLGSKRSGLFV